MPELAGGVPKSFDGSTQRAQPIGAEVRGKAPKTAKGPILAKVERIGNGVASVPSETKLVPLILGECPVCAERRRKKAKAQKNWRKKAKKK